MDNTARIELAKAHIEKGLSRSPSYIPVEERPTGYERENYVIVEPKDFRYEVVGQKVFCTYISEENHLELVLPQLVFVPNDGLNIDTHLKEGTFRITLKVTP